MIVELHINGSLQVQLTPETSIEKAVVHEMAEAAKKGKSVKMDLEPETGKVIVSIEK